MASRLKWLATVLVGCALMTAWAHTIRVDYRAPAAASDLRRDLDDAVLALLNADAAYREYALADSILPLLPATPGLKVELSPTLPADARNLVVSVASREMQDIDVPRARVGIFLADNEYGRRPSVPLRSRSEERKLHVGEDSIGPYCAIIATGTVTDDSMRSDGFRAGFSIRRGVPPGSVLGPCWFVATYGVPGPGLSQWLENGGYGLATHAGTPRSERMSAVDRLTLWAREDIRMRGCIGGRLDLCTEVVTDLPARRTTTAAYELGAVGRLGPYPVMLSDLESKFGRERFERFWTSGDDLPAAFAAAFGLDVGEWVQEWGEGYYGPQTLGPAVKPFNTLSTFGVILLLAAAGCAIAFRRSI